MNKIKHIIFLVIFFQSLSFCAIALESVSELKDITSENNFLLIEVAKKYPVVNLLQFQNPKRIVVELLESKYHRGFKFDVTTKKDILKGLSFATDASIGVAKYGADLTKVSISLFLNDSSNLTPKLISTKDNIVLIGFMEPNIIKTIDDQQIEELNKQNVLVDFYNMALGETVNGNIMSAEENYKNALAQDENFFIAKYNLAKLYIDEERFQDAENLLLEIVEKIDFNNDQEKTLYCNSKNLLGVAYYLNNEIEKAIEQFSGLIKLDPNFNEAYFNLGLAYEKISNTENALSNFQRTIELKPDHVKAHYHLGVLQLILKDKENAASNFKKVLELVSDENDRYYKLSNAELQRIEKRNRSVK